MRELERVRIALAAQLVQQRAAGIRQAQHARRLVKGLARRVVHRLAQQRIDAVIVHAHDVRMAAGGHQADKRRLQVPVRDVVRADVALDVVDRDERLARRVRQRLRRGDADEQRAHQARAVGYGDGVHVRKGHVCLFEALVHDRVHALHMLAGGDLRHHAAVHRVQRNLRGDDRGDDLPAVADDRRRRLVAAGFNRQDRRVAALAEPFRLRPGTLFVIHARSPLSGPCPLPLPKSLPKRSSSVLVARFFTQLPSDAGGSCSG